MEWIDEQRAACELGEASIRHNMNLLSRFFSWAIARGKASINPVRQIPMGSRPTQSVKSDTPWLDDDAIVRKLINDLEEPISFMFYLCNRSGLRTGEAAGLRMSDMAFVDEGLIRVRFSYDGPLKEDKKSEGKVKWVPAPEDCGEFLGAWLVSARRKARVLRIACSRAHVARGSATARSTSSPAGRTRPPSTSVVATCCSRRRATRSRPR
jgi:integrase